MYGLVRDLKSSLWGDEAFETVTAGLAMLAGQPQEYSLTAKVT